MNPSICREAVAANDAGPGLGRDTLEALARCLEPTHEIARQRFRAIDWPRACLLYVLSGHDEATLDRR